MNIWTVNYVLRMVTPGGTLVIGPGGQGETALEQTLVGDIRTIGDTSFGQAATMSGLMLLGPDDFDDSSEGLGLTVEVTTEPEPENLHIVDGQLSLLVHGILLYPATVYQQEAP